MARASAAALVTGLVLLALSASASAQLRSIDRSHSRMTVHVGKAGLLSALGDDHEIEAPIAAGAVDQARRTVQFTVNAGELKVLDPQLAADKRSQVQQRMEGGDCLDVTRYPQIAFRSTSVDEQPSGELRVQGLLTLHGETRPVVVSVHRAGDHYAGGAEVRQSDFGIKPVTAAAGTIKTKDQVRIDFDIVVAPVSAPTR